ncbi:hypothetical protein Mapa_001328 [Marchantia paleacea]|nr:hypothetical protein Mapa_001328 [Marchantia paleacea]
MWNCLPLTFWDRSEEEIEVENSARRAEISQRAARLRTASKKMDIDTRVLLSGSGSESGGQRESLVADSAAVITRSVMRPSTRQSISLWFGYVVEYLGQTLLNYLAGVAEKMDKREYY